MRVVELRAQHRGELVGQRRDVEVLAPLRMRADAVRLLHQDLKVHLHGLADPGALHLHGDGGAVGQGGAVDLADAGRGEGGLVEGREQLTDGASELGLDALLHLLPGERGDVVLELGELGRKVGGDQVAARRQDLPQLDERRPQPLEGVTDAHRRRQVFLLAGESVHGLDRVRRDVLLERAALERAEDALLPQHLRDLAIARAPEGAAAPRRVLVTTHGPSPSERGDATRRLCAQGPSSPPGLRALPQKTRRARTEGRVRARPWRRGGGAPGRDRRAPAGAARHRGGLRRRRPSPPQPGTRRRGRSGRRRAVLRAGRRRARCAARRGWPPRCRG